MRIFPVVLGAHASSESTLAGTRSSSCLLCRHGDTVKRSNPALAQIDTASGRTGRDRQGDDADCQFRTWLLRFYTAKVPDKVPYVDVILNRYRGRHDDLKAQLCAKYGELDTGDDDDDKPDISNSSDSSEDSDDDGDSSSTTPVNFRELSMSRDWLLKFYQQYQPEKLLHVDKVLKQFSGREDTLKQMLITKYCSALPTAVAGESHSQEGPLKRRKVGSTTLTTSAPATTEPLKGSEEPPIVFVNPQTDDEEAPAAATSSSLCYIMKCVLVRACRRR